MFVIEREEFDGLVDFHRQHFADVLAAPRHRERLRIEALAVADVARHLHVGQETHADRAHALALARRATAFAGIEREARRRVAARAGFERAGEQLADRVPHADVSRRTRARRLADRRLIDFEHAVDRFPAGDAAQPCHACVTFELRARRLRATARSAPVRARAHRLGRRARAARRRRRQHRPPDRIEQIGHQHVARERRFAGAADARDRDEPAERNADRDIAQVVQLAAVHRQPVLRRVAARFAWPRALRGAAATDARSDARETGRSANRGVRRQVADAALRDQRPAALARARPDIDDVIGAPDRVLVMLDDHQRIALVAELRQRVSRIWLSRGCRPMVGSSST